MMQELSKVTVTRKQKQKISVMGWGGGVGGGGGGGGDDKVGDNKHFNRNLCKLKILLRHHMMSCLIRIYTVCYFYYAELHSAEYCQLAATQSWTRVAPIWQYSSPG